MRLTPKLLLVLCFVPLLAFADPPAQSGRGGPPRRSPGERWDRGGSPTESPDWELAEQFFRDHSPNRWQAFADLPETHREKNRMRSYILGTYRSHQWLARDEELLANKIRQMELKDEIFGLRMHFRGAEPTEQQRHFGHQLREKVGALVEARLEEREMRIRRLQKLLEEEQERLERDEREKESLIARELERELQEAREGPPSADDAFGPPRRDRDDKSRDRDHE